MRVLWLLPLALGACAATPEDPCPNALTWETFGDGFVHQYCAGCHSTSIPTTQREGAPDIVNLETYTGVLRWSGRLLNTAGAEPPTMPPGGGTTAEERALLAEWLACEVLPDAARVEDLPL